MNQEFESSELYTRRCRKGIFSADISYSLFHFRGWKRNHVTFDIRDSCLFYTNDSWFINNFLPTFMIHFPLFYSQNWNKHKIKLAYVIYCFNDLNLFSGIEFHQPFNEPWPKLKSQRKRSQKLPFSFEFGPVHKYLFPMVKTKSSLSKTFRTSRVQFSVEVTDFRFPYGYDENDRKLLSST